MDACLNECGHCELCLGKDTLPDDCFESGTGAGSGGGGGGGAATGGGGDATGSGGGDATGSGGGPTGEPQGQCATGIQPCGLAGQEPCAAGYYCITGCCQVILN